MDGGTEISKKKQRGRKGQMQETNKRRDESITAPFKDFRNVLRLEMRSEVKYDVKNNLSNP